MVLRSQCLALGNYNSVGVFCLFVSAGFFFFFCYGWKNTCLIKMDMCTRNNMVGEKSKIHIHNFR